MKSRAIAMLAMVALLAGGVVLAEKADKKINIKKAKCPISGKPAKDVDGSSVAYKGGKVFLCCTNCPNAFKKDPTKFAAKANFQLYVTKQAKLVACAFSGKALNPATKIEIDGQPVCFCCNNCKAKAEKAADKVACVFGDATFAKGFKVGAKKKK